MNIKCPEHKTDMIKKILLDKKTVVYSCPKCDIKYCLTIEKKDNETEKETVSRLIETIKSQTKSYMYIKNCIIEKFTAFVETDRIEHSTF